MSQETPPQKPRRPHPLEREPEPLPPPPPDQKQIMLHIPFVKPRVTYILIAINLVIFVVGLFSTQAYNLMVEWGAIQKIRVFEFGEYHRLFTAMFLHAGYAHVLFNMYALYLFGRSIEGLFGHLRFVIIYFLGGLGGSVLSVVFNAPSVTSVGASGAVFAVFGAEMIYLYQHRKLLGARGRAELQQLLIIAGLNFAVGILSVFSPTGVNIDNWAHLGGVLGGAVLTWYIGPYFIPQPHPSRPDAYIAEDINPLKNRYQALPIYIAALLTLLIVAVMAFTR